VRPLLRTLFFAVSIVLVIACFNVAGLLLVRAIRRRREYAVRLALGAQSGVIIRESVFEGLLLSFAGGALGLAFAAIAIRTALHLLPESMPRVDSISMDAAVASFAFLLALVTGALCKPCARLRGLANQPYGKSERGSANWHGGVEPYLAALSPGGVGDCNRAGAAHRGWGLPAQFPEDAGCRPGLPSGQCSGRRLSASYQTIFHGCFC